MADKVSTKEKHVFLLLNGWVYNPNRNGAYKWYHPNVIIKVFGLENELGVPAWHSFNEAYDHQTGNCSICL